MNFRMFTYYFLHICRAISRTTRRRRAEQHNVLFVTINTSYPMHPKDCTCLYSVNSAAMTFDYSFVQLSVLSLFVVV